MASPGIGRGGAARVVVVALATACLASGCTSLTGGEHGTEACRQVRDDFNTYLSRQTEANNAFLNADDHWNDIYNAYVDGSLDKKDLAGGVDDMNADVKRAKAQATSAAATLQAFQDGMQQCGAKDMPPGCTSEFRQYRRILVHEKKMANAVKSLVNAVTAQRQAVVAQDIAAMNASVDRHNAAQDQISDLTTRYNDDILPAYNKALKACDEALR